MDSCWLGSGFIVQANAREGNVLLVLGTHLILA